MNHWMNKLLSMLLCLALLASMPFAALAASSLDENPDEDIDQSIAANPDLTEEEKQQWIEWANADTSDDATDAATVTDEEGNVSAADAEALAELEAAMSDSDKISEEDVGDLELNDALPSNVVNILLLGVDNRSEELVSGLSDAVIICSLNMDTGSVKLTSITRDTAVELPGYKSKKRINCAFKYGSKDGVIADGGKLAMKTVNRNFRMNIQRYVVVNIHGLANIIDALGGVDMDMTSKEAGRINYELRKEPMDKVKRDKVQAIDGVQHLDGMQAVTYARIRGIDNDFFRTERQRKLLATLMAKVMEDIDITKMITLIETALPYGATNLSAEELIQYGSTVISGEAMSNLQSGASVLEQFRIPMDGTFKYLNVSGATLTGFRSAAREKENIVAMQEFIYGQSYYKD